MSTTTPGPTAVRILAVEADVQLREPVSQILTLAGHTVRFAASAAEAHRLLASEPFDVVLADAGIAEARGLLALASTACPAGEVSVVAAVSGARSTELPRHGVKATVARPYDAEELLRVIERAAHEALRGRELVSLRALLGGRADPVLIGRSPAMQRLRELVQRAAASRATVVVTGEAGTGKELVARTIHALSERSRGPCVLVECGDRDAASVEAELFGTGESVHHAGQGALARAAGGTVILDDAAALPAAIQSRVLRVLQERALVGGSTADFRLLATVREERARGFTAPAPRYDLIARAGVFSIALPPLRDRRSDIPLLAAHFRAQFARETGAEPPALTPEGTASLLAYDWPGNVRQLEHYMGRLLLMPPGARVPFEGPAPSLEARATVPSLVEAARVSHWTLDELEREYITRILAEERGHQSRAATRLGIDRRTLYRKLKQYRAHDAVRRSTAPRAVEKTA